MTCFFYIGRIVGSVFFAGVMGVLYKRKSRAVGYLSGKHKFDLFVGHFGSKVNNALNVLYGVTVAESVAEPAVLERGCSGPDKGDKAVVGVPHVYHIVEIIVGSVYL